MHTSYDRPILRSLVRGLATHPYQVRLIDGHAPWNQSDMSTLDLREHEDFERKVAELGSTREYIGLNEHRAELAMLLAETILGCGVGIVIDGPDARISADIPELHPMLAQMLQDNGFVHPERSVFRIYDSPKVSHGVCHHCYIWGEVEVNGRIRRGLQRAYILANPALEPVRVPVAPPDAGLVAGITILSTCHQYPTLRRARAAATRIERAMVDYWNLKSREQSTGDQYTGPIGAEEDPVHDLVYFRP